jgi:hypothetical protein
MFLDIVSNLVMIFNCFFLYIIYSISNIFMSCIYFPTNKETILEEKGQYMTNAFTTTCDYLVLATKFLPFSISVTSC